MMSLVLPMCILISCSSVLCVPMASGKSMFVKAMLSPTSVISPPPCLCSLSVRTVEQWGCFSFLCEFCLLHCDDVRLGAVYEVLQFPHFVSNAVYVDLQYDDVFPLFDCCLRVGGSLFVMSCCVVCARRCCYVLCVSVNGASPVRFVLSLFYLCAFHINPVCAVCVVTSD